MERMEVYEGAKVIGYITVTEITNPILDRDKEKWVLLDGRKIHTMKQFYEQVQEHFYSMKKWLVKLLSWGDISQYE